MMGLSLYEFIRDILTFKGFRDGSTKQRALWVLVAYPAAALILVVGMLLVIPRLVGALVYKLKRRKIR